MVELFANRGDPDQTPRSAASGLGLHCLSVTRLGVSGPVFIGSKRKEEKKNPPFFFSQRRHFLCRPICFLSHQSFSEKGVHSKRKECAPTESTVFPLRVDPFLEGRQNNFDNVISLESVSISLDIRSQIKGIWRVFRHSVDPGIYIDVKPSSVAQLDARPTGDQEVESSTPAGTTTFFCEDWPWNMFLRSCSPFRWFKKGSCQFLAK